MKVKQNSKNFYIRLFVTAGAIILVMYLAKVWFFGSGQQQSNKIITYTDDVSETGDKKVSKETFVKKSPMTILWQDANKYYGEYVTVKGKIVRTHNSGKVCFLNFNPDYKRNLTLVIFASSFASFPPDPEKYYQNKEVIVTGYIKEYNGKPEIILNSQNQIKVVNN